MHQIPNKFHLVRHFINQKVNHLIKDALTNSVIPLRDLGNLLPSTMLRRNIQISSKLGGRNRIQILKTVDTAQKRQDQSLKILGINNCSINSKEVGVIPQRKQLIQVNIIPVITRREPLLDIILGHNKNFVSN